MHQEAYKGMPASSCEAKLEGPSSNEITFQEALKDMQHMNETTHSSRFCDLQVDS